LKGKARLVKAGTSSLVRTSQDSTLVARSLSNTETKKSLYQVVKPNSVSKTLRKAGVAVLLSPDPLGPIADVPGVLLLGASYAMKKREPQSIKSLFKETQMVLDELQPLL
jgi:hypothetical protein